MTMKLTDSRRWTGRFLTALAILVLVFSSGLNQSALAERQECHASSLDKSDVTDSNRDWVEPPVLQADDGNSDFTVNLTAKLVKKTVDTLFDNCNLYSYEFSCGDHCPPPDWDEEIPVGPTIKVKPGDILHVNLQNELMGKTNLHTHGLHISPKDHEDGLFSSDNVLLEINNGESHSYRFEIPENHYPGTFWYHPHVHGTTATQVEDGMAGALIVEDPTDPNWVNEGEDPIEDRIFVFQQIPMFKDYNSSPIAPQKEKKDFEVTINGVLNPKITMDLGELERWRFIHAGEAESIALDFNSLISDDPDDSSSSYEFRLIALDGITLEYPRDIRELPDKVLELYPGYRADVIVKAPRTQSQLQGKSSLTNNRQKVVRLFDKAKPYNPSLRGQDYGGPLEDLVTLELTEEDSVDYHRVLPDNDVVLRDPTEEGLLHDIDINPNEIDNAKLVEFNIENSEFTINGKKYPDDQDQGEKFCLEKGKSQFWKLASRASAHPFHIHVNAFQVVNPEDSGTTIGDWHDTIIVKRTDYDANDEPINPVIIKTRYDDFDGPFVLHCHILHHEDAGMMSLVEITDVGMTDDDDDSCNTTSPALAKIDK